MNNLYKIAVILLLTLLCAAVFYTSVKADKTMLKVCPVNAISQQGNIAVIDSLKCINCGRCFTGIPSPYNFTLFPNIKPKADSDTELISKQPDQKPTNSGSVIPNPENQKPGALTVNKETKAALPIATKPAKETSSVVKSYFKVNSSSCIGCQLCVSNCPVNAITMQNGKAVIDADKCTACGICANGSGESFAGCPTAAITKVTGKVRKPR